MNHTTTQSFLQTRGWIVGLKHRLLLDKYKRGLQQSSSTIQFVFDSIPHHLYTVKVKKFSLAPKVMGRGKLGGGGSQASRTVIQIFLKFHLPSI